MTGSILRIAIRNVTRNTRRSLITALAVLIGTGAIVVGRGLLNGVSDIVIGGVTEAVTGDVQIHREGYLAATEALPLNLTLDYDDAFRALIAQDDDVVETSGRIAFSGLVSDAQQENTTVFYGLGMNPDHEFTVTPRNQINVVAGQPLSNDEPQGIVVGEALAQNLGLKVGDEITLLVNTQKGSLNGKDVTVRGIARFKLPGLVNKAIHIPLKTAQDLLYMQGQVTEVAVKLKSNSIPAVRRYHKRLKAQLAANTKGLESNTWVDVSALYTDSLDMMDQVFAVLIVVFFIIMIAGIVNTMLMSVLERVSEIGTMMAIGVRRRKILSLFLMEAAALGLVGSVVGTGLGLLISFYYGHAGLVLPLPGGTEAAVYPHVGPLYLLGIIAAALVVSAVAALYPAWRASLLSPVDALRA